jgi:hypothetical protein
MCVFQYLHISDLLGCVFYGVPWKRIRASRKTDCGMNECISARSLLLLIFFCGISLGYSILRHLSDAQCNRASYCNDSAS